MEVIGTSTLDSPRTTQSVRVLDALAALALAALCSTRVYWALGRPALTGIDDENITQVYGRNIARGLGYVYTPGFEHVEGATSSLWVAIHAILYRITDSPEPYILLCSLIFTTLALYWTAGIARSLSAAMGLSSWPVWLCMVAVAAQPAYFHWTVVSMMDQGVWGALMIGLVSAMLSRLDAERQSISASGLVLCILCTVTRPEAMLLVPAVVVLASAVIAAQRGPRAAVRYGLPYIGAFLVALLTATVLRMRYFGYPFPNTYYAKVSSRPLDNLVQGLHYVIEFLTSNVLAIPMVLAVLLALMTGVHSWWLAIRSGRALSRAEAIGLVVGGTCAAVLATVVLEGGDHFPASRMLQPYVPLMSVCLIFYIPLFSGWQRFPLGLAGRFAWSACLVAALLVGNYSAFRLSNKGLVEDFTLARDGRRVGEYLNLLGPENRPDVGVLPAGGIAVTYGGRVADLLGLNWTEMAHASGRRKGMPGHSGFDRGVFWKHPTQLLLPELIDPTRPLDTARLPANFELYTLKGLLNEPRFREEYRPVQMRLGDGQVFAYARLGFIESHRNDARITPMDWGSFRPPVPITDF